MNIQASDLIYLMNQWAPEELAESWDHPGLQVGNPGQSVKKVLISLDLTEENVSYAIAHGVDMVISHHPFLFKPIHRLDLTSYKGHIIEQLIKKDILAFAAHTNLDTAEEGVNDALADALGLVDKEGLVPEKKYALLKVSIHTVRSKAEAFQQLLEREYKEMAGPCSFFCESSGKEGTLEFTVDERAVSHVLSDLERIKGVAHYEVWELVNGGRQEFMGRIGNLPKPLVGEEALLYIKKKLGIPNLRYVGNSHILVKRIAVLGGAGSEFAALAKARGADLYLTGDLKYHEAQDIAAQGLLVVDGGHFYTERVIVLKLAERIRREAAKRGWDLEVLEDSKAEDIFKNL